MGSNPVNLALRFLLELVALAAMGFWGKQKADGWLGYAMAIGMPLLMAVIWGVFAVPDDPSRSGDAPIPISGWMRLLIEALIFVTAVWMLFDLGYSNIAWIFGAVVLVHYVLSYDRILWLFNK